MSFLGESYFTAGLTERQKQNTIRAGNSRINNVAGQKRDFEQAFSTACSLFKISR